MCILLVLIVPDADRLVHGAGSDEGFPDTDVHSSHLPVVEGLREKVKCHCACTLEEGWREEGREEGMEGGREGGREVGWLACYLLMVSWAVYVCME